MSASAAPPGWDHREPVMGTGARVVVHGADREVAAAATGAAMAWLHRVDATFSTYRADSEVRRLDAGTLAPADASPEVRHILELCDELSRRTGGWFDARAGGALDPSGVVKGWAVERASAILADAGCPGHMVECGGDVRVRPRARLGPWQVGVTHPHRLDAYCALLSVDDGAVATSGTYERGWHVVDPHRGVPARGLDAVTVVGPELTTADAWSTAALAMGRECLDWLPTLDGWEWLVIDEDGRGWTSPGFDALRTPLAAARTLPGGEAGRIAAGPPSSENPTSVVWPVLVRPALHGPTAA